MKIYSDVLVSEAYKAFKDEGLSHICDGDSMSVSVEEEDDDQHPA